MRFTDARDAIASSPLYSAVFLLSWVTLHGQQIGLLLSVSVVPLLQGRRGRLDTLLVKRDRGAHRKVREDAAVEHLLDCRGGVDGAGEAHGRHMFLVRS